jgi:hypothetical protein
MQPLYGASMLRTYSINLSLISPVEIQSDYGLERVYPNADSSLENTLIDFIFHFKAVLSVEKSDTGPGMRPESHIIPTIECGRIN